MLDADAAATIPSCGRGGGLRKTKFTVEGYYWNIGGGDGWQGEDIAREHTCDDPLLHSPIHTSIVRYAQSLFSPVHSHPIPALERQIVGCYAIIISFQICTCYNNFWRTSGTECPLNRKKQCLHHGHVDSFVVHQTHLQFYVASS